MAPGEPCSNPTLALAVHSHLTAARWCPVLTSEGHGGGQRRMRWQAQPRAGHLVTSSLYGHICSAQASPRGSGREVPGCDPGLPCTAGRPAPEPFPSGRRRYRTRSWATRRGWRTCCTGGSSWWPRPRSTAETWRSAWGNCKSRGTHCGRRRPDGCSACGTPARRSSIRELMTGLVKQ